MSTKPTYTIVSDKYMIYDVVSYMGEKMGRHTHIIIVYNFPLKKLLIWRKLKRGNICEN